MKQIYVTREGAEEARQIMEKYSYLIARETWDVIFLQINIRITYPIEDSMGVLLDSRGFKLLQRRRCTSKACRPQKQHSLTHNGQPSKDQ